MSKIPAKVISRLTTGLKRFQSVLTSARSRDVNESDTVVIITDILSDILGYEKYAEITSEHMIRGTFCDLAIHLDGELALLVEVKAVGIQLKEQHVKQAVDYAANKGCEWVALTNGITWQVYRVIFGKPLDRELIAEVDLLALNPRKQADLAILWAISKEGWKKSRLTEYATQQAALSRYSIAAALMSDASLALLRRELRKLNPGAQIDLAEMKAVLMNDVVKREVLEGDKADAARLQLSRAVKKPQPKREIAPAAVVPKALAGG